MKDYSQHGEQQLITDHFTSTGKFLDIGAYDGLNLSNTRRLSELGWSGVLIEASPVNFVKLLQNETFGNRLINAAVALSTGLIKFYETDSPCSSTSLEHCNKFNASVKEIEVGAITIDSLDYSSDYFQFISIDVEGNNYEILNEVLKKFKPKLICVEIDNPEAEAKIRLINEYKVCKKIGVNLILV